MPASPRDILRRIRGIKSTQQITKAMEMVSAVKLTRVCNQAENARSYVDAMSRMVRILCTTAGDSEHELFKERELKAILLIVLTSDRGLCGTFNTSVINAVEAFRQEHAGRNISFLCIGRKGAEALARLGYAIEEALDVPWGPAAIHKEVERINYNVLGAFEAGRYDAVYLLYSRFENVLVYKPTVVQHLPVPRLSAEEAKSLAKWAIDFLLEPNFDGLANALIPQHLETQLHYALVESLASEYAARMVAMRNANDNAEEVISELNLSYNKARQATITRDLIDIIGGVEALNG